jgi:dihydrofolate synthase/folylpolyglutamate synthase
VNYSETIDYLYNKLPLFSRMGSAAFKKDLTNILILCERLGNPHTKFKTIHVGGTNGKGSVSHMLAAVLQMAGYKTGLYTSPHLYDFRERIRINGEMVEENFVIDFVEKIKPVIEAIEPSFFEITVAMAFEYFAQQKADVAVIEVGLGGRLDSTNIISPQLSVITNIGWDHMNMLGNTLQEIAAEKAGIIKENIPVVIGERKEETAAVFEKTAQTKNAPILFAEDQYKTHSYRWKADHFLLEIWNASVNKAHSFELDLPGIYQQKNLCTVLTSIDELRKNYFVISDRQVFDGLKSAKQLTGLKGRWEVIQRNPVVVLEVAHNREGIEQMLQHLQNIQYKKLHLIIGMVKDKDITKVLELLPGNAEYYFTQAHIPRALPAPELKQKAGFFSLYGDGYDDVNIALQQALHKANKDDLVIVCGSIFLVAEVDKKSILHLA